MTYLWPMAELKQISFLDLAAEYKMLRSEIDVAMKDVCESGQFINGPVVQEFCNALGSYLNTEHVIPCANGTEALQAALMALNLQPGAEIIVPAFTYAAPVEVILLLGFEPVLCDINVTTFNLDVDTVQKSITDKTAAVIPVHLFGQSCEMESLLEVTKAAGIYVIEDNAQAINSTYTFSNGVKVKTGNIGDVGCLSFFPTKNLGCFGDGGAITTNNAELARKLKMVVSHGQSSKYHHRIIGINSRLDALQAAILNVKLQHLAKSENRRKTNADHYRARLKELDDVVLPFVHPQSDHVYHQFTIRVKKGKRNALKKHLYELGIPSVQYYPLPIHRQVAYSKYFTGQTFPAAEQACDEVLSLPVHPMLNDDEIGYITEAIISFFKR